jgi:hypothetical protein
MGDDPSVANAISILEPVLLTGRHFGGVEGLRLWLVTAGGSWGQEGVKLNVPDLLQATVAGMFRTVSSELPGVTTRLLDLDPNSENAFAIAVGELLSDPPEDEISYRDGRRFACEISTINPDSLGPKELSPRESRSVAFDLKVH